jgi:surface antigen
MKPTIPTAALCLAVVAMISVGGCATRQYATPEEAVKSACSSLGPKAASGALIGAAAGAAGGGLIGAAAGNTKGALIGAGLGLLVGAIAGGAAGHNLDQQDCAQAQIALQQMQTLPTGQSVAWSSPTGSHGSITAFTDDYEVGGRVCRRIRSDVYLQNHEPVYGDEGVVCRDANGDWARVSQ